MIPTAVQPRQIASGPADQMVRLLEQLAGVVARLDDAHYRAKRAREVSGSVGGHVRHCLDHVAALIRGIEGGLIDYDARVRGTAIESRRDAALHEIARLVHSMQMLGVMEPTTQVAVALGEGPDNDAATATSTVARELAFVLSHTIHHFAIVALLLHDMGVRVPPRFGYAPSTPSPELAA
jgi:uncharacterized damage-inducible protein DinB